MEKLINHEKVINYLQSGKQTIITPDILEVANLFTKETIQEKITEVLQFLRTLKYNPENKNNVFRKRTASEIITSKYVTGCTDDALVFISIIRALGIQAKYIETLDLSWLSKGGYPITGHVYVGVYINNKWQIVDPSSRKECVDIQKDDRVITGEGLDSWDIGAVDFESLEKISENFRLNWNKQ